MLKIGLLLRTTTLSLFHFRIFWNKKSWNFSHTRILRINFDRKCPRIRSPVSIFDVPSNRINVQCLNIKSTSPRNHFRMRSRIQDFFIKFNQHGKSNYCLFDLQYTHIRLNLIHIPQKNHNELIHILFSTVFSTRFCIGRHFKNFEMNKNSRKSF